MLLFTFPSRIDATNSLQGSYDETIEKLSHTQTKPKPCRQTLPALKQLRPDSQPRNPRFKFEANEETKTYVLSHLLLRNLALRLLLVLVVLELHRLQLARVPVAGQLVVRDGQRSKVSWVRLPRDEGVRCRLQHAIDSSEREGG